MKVYLDQEVQRETLDQMDHGDQKETVERVVSLDTLELLVNSINSHEFSKIFNMVEF